MLLKNGILPMLNFYLLNFCRHIKKSRQAAKDNGGKGNRDGSILVRHNLVRELVKRGIRNN